MLKILFLPLYNLWGPSSRYRLFQYLNPLTQLGFVCKVIPAPEKIFRLRLLYPFKLLFAASKTDVIFIQKRTLPKGLLRLLHRINPNIIFDFDDAIYLIPEKRKQLDAMLSIVKNVVVGNQHLAEYVKNIRLKVYLLPTVVDTTKYVIPEKDAMKLHSPIVIGWIGVNPNFGSLTNLQKVLDRMEEKYPNKLLFRVIGNQSWNMDTKMHKDFLLWKLNHSHLDLQNFDVGIMPLDDSPWNRGKCGLKLIQYMAVGKPCVASSVGVNQEIIIDGETGFLVSSNDEWVESLSFLVENKNERKTMGMFAREKVINHYSVRAALPKLVKILLNSADSSKN